MARIVKASRVKAKVRRPRAKTVKKVVSARAKNAGKSSKSVSMHMVRKARANHKRPPTGIELTVKAWLDQAGANYKTEHPIGLTHVDFYLPDTNTVVEVNGCYWHAHDCQKKGEKFSSKQARKRSKDGKRYSFLQNCGKHVLLLWECQIHERPDLAKSKLLARVNPI